MLKLPHQTHPCSCEHLLKGGPRGWGSLGAKFSPKAAAYTVGIYPGEAAGGGERKPDPAQLVSPQGSPPEALPPEPQPPPPAGLSSLLVFPTLDFSGSTSVFLSLHPPHLGSQGSSSSEPFPKFSAAHQTWGAGYHSSLPLGHGFLPPKSLQGFQRSTAAWPHCSPLRGQAGGLPEVTFPFLRTADSGILNSTFKGRERC